MVLRSYEISIPLEVVERGVTELGTGVRIILNNSVQLWRAKRISACELESLLHSVAWQSPTLKSYFDGLAGPGGANEGCEVLSEEDMWALRNGEWPGEWPVRKKVRTTEHADAAHASAVPAPQRSAELAVEPALEMLSKDDLVVVRPTKHASKNSKFKLRTTSARADTMPSSVASVDPVIVESWKQAERLAVATRGMCRVSRSSRFSHCGSTAASCAGSTCGSSLSRGGRSRKKMVRHVNTRHAEEKLLPYVPKVYELYVMCTLPMVPFLLLLFFLGPMIFEEFWHTSSMGQCR